MLVIGVTGHAQHGKDTLGGQLERYGFARAAFADQLRDLAWALNPYVKADAGKPNRYREVVADLGYEAAKRLPEVRRVLQELGVGVRRVIGEDAWVNALATRLEREQPARAVITDVRFPNEAAWVHAQGGIVVRVTRVNADGSPFDNGVGIGHESEALVDSLPVDLTLVNDGTDAFGNGIGATLAEALRAQAAEPSYIDTGTHDFCTTEYEASLPEDTTPTERARQYRYKRLDKVPDSEHLDAMRAAEQRAKWAHEARTETR